MSVDVRRTEGGGLVLVRPTAVTTRPMRCLRCDRQIRIFIFGPDLGTGPSGHHLVHSGPTVCGACASAGERS